MSGRIADVPVAAVTGAAQGLGAEIALRLARDGFDLALLDITEEGLHTTRDSVAAASPDTTVVCLSGDLSEESTVWDSFATIGARFGRLDALVNTAGGSGTDLVRSLDDLSVETWRKVLDNNLTSTFLCCQAAVPLMRRLGDGRIVNFSSAVANGIAGPSGTVGARLPYAASKAAVNGLTKQLAKDLGREGITVNSIAPGLVLPEHGRVREIFESLDDEAQAATRAAIPVGRTGTGAEVAALVAYLVSPHAGFTTGAVFAIDGAAT